MCENLLVKSGACLLLALSFHDDLAMGTQRKVRYAVTANHSYVIMLACAHAVFVSAVLWPTYYEDQEDCV